MKLQLLFSIMITIIIIVYLRNRRITMLEHLIDFSTELAQDSIPDFQDVEDMSGTTQKLLDIVLKNKSEIDKLMNHESDNKFSSSEMLTNVVSQKNQMKLLENDTLLKQLEGSLKNLNDANPSISELISKYGGSK
jgi:hypothetical protein